MNSLERRLQLGLAVAVALMMLVFWWGGMLVVRTLADSTAYARLAADAANVRATVLPSGGWPSARPGRSAPRLYPAYDAPASGRYWSVRFADGRRLDSASARAQTYPVPLLAPGAVRRSRVTGRAGETLQLWAGGFAIDGTDVTIAVARDIDDVLERLDAVGALLLGFSLALLAVLLAVQRAIVRRSLAGLDALRADMERLGHGEITALHEDVPDEVRPLVLEFNRLLERFDQRLRQSRNAVGNLAHALKGPLNLLIRAADETVPGVGAPAAVARIGAGPVRPGDSLNEEAATRVRHGAERIRQLIEAELRRARLVGRTSAGRRFDLEAEVRALAGLLGQVYAEKHIEVRLAIGADVSVVHDRQDMLELIGNLIDNAVKWADTLVMVSARSADGLLLEVEDDGPGVSEEAIRDLARRGVRLDESVAGDGLGLAIVRDIVASYGGELQLGRSNRLGGFRAVARLPDGRTR